MSDVKWIKIVTDIFDDEKIMLIESLPEADSIIVIWFKLLCLAGKQNNSGVFQINGRIPYTEEMFATIFRRKINTVRLALHTFEQYGMIEIINSTVTIPNWEKHQRLDALELAREATRKRVAKHREKQRMLSCGNVDSNSASNVTDNVTSNVTDDVTVTDSNADRIDKNRIDKNNNTTRKRAECEILSGFDDFWAVYPKKDAKQAAVKAWLKLKPDDDLKQAIIAGVQRDIDGRWKGAERRYIPNPTTYLNQRRWEDEITPTKTDDDEYYPRYREYHPEDDFKEPVPRTAR